MEKKKPYKRPDIVRIELRPEDAVLTACKTVSGSARLIFPNRCKTNNCANKAKGS